MAPDEVAVKCSPHALYPVFLDLLKTSSSSRSPLAALCSISYSLAATAAQPGRRPPASAPPASSLGAIGVLPARPLGHHTTTLAALTATASSCATVVLMPLVVFVATTTLTALDTLAAMVHNITIINQFRSVFMEYLVNIGGGVVAILAVFTAVFYFSDVFMRFWNEVLLENPTILISVVLVTLGALAALSAVML